MIWASQEVGESLSLSGAIPFYIQEDAAHFSGRVLVDASAVLVMLGYVQDSYIISYWGPCYRTSHLNSIASRITAGPLIESELMLPSNQSSAKFLNSLSLQAHCKSL